jgi:hypothetical protein
MLEPRFLVFLALALRALAISSAGEPIDEWLVSVNPALRIYGESLSEYGYENVGLLIAAEDADLVECFESLGIKKPHRRLILKQREALQQGGAVAMEVSPDGSTSSAHETVVREEDGEEEDSGEGRDHEDEYNEADDDDNSGGQVRCPRKVDKAFNKAERLVTEAFELMSDGWGTDILLLAEEAGEVLKKVEKHRCLKGDFEFTELQEAAFNASDNVLNQQYGCMFDNAKDRPFAKQVLKQGGPRRKGNGKGGNKHTPIDDRTDATAAPAAAKGRGGWNEESSEAEQVS